MEDPTPEQRDQVDQFKRYDTEASALLDQHSEYRYMAAGVIVELLDGNASHRQLKDWIGYSRTWVQRTEATYRHMTEHDIPAHRYQESWRMLGKPQNSQEELESVPSRVEDTDLGEATQVAPDESDEPDIEELDQACMRSGWDYTMTALALAADRTKRPREAPDPQTKRKIRRYIKTITEWIEEA